MENKLKELFGMVGPPGGGGTDVDMPEAEGGRAFKRFRGWEGRAASLDNNPRGTNKGGAVMNEIQDMLSRRITVEGFLDNTTKEKREELLNAFLTEHNLLDNFPEAKVFAKGKTGNAAIIEFKKPMDPKQFIQDNLQTLKTFKSLGKGGGMRDMFWNQHKSPSQWKAYHSIAGQ